MTKDDLDPSICGEDGPISAEDCALWLDAKYRRHGELEDRAAAMWLRKLSARPAAEPKACQHTSTDSWWGSGERDGGVYWCLSCGAFRTSDEREWRLPSRTNEL